MFTIFTSKNCPEKKAICGGRLNLFLIICVIDLLFSLPITSSAEAQILLPTTPRSATPPRAAPETHENQIRKKRRNRQKRDKRFIKPKPKAADVRDRELLTQALKKRPMAFAVELNLVIPGVKTFGKRSGYTADITTHLRVISRADQDKKTDEIQLWWGGRAAMFSGTGIYDEVPGRYGFTYFGPMIGVGKISLGSQSSGFNPKKGDKIANHDLPTRKGWLLMSGIAAQSRLSSVDRSSRGTLGDSSDFDNPKGVKFDAPGLWAEITYITIHFGAVGVHYSGGVQFGKQKTFAYFSVGVAGWH